MLNEFVLDAAVVTTEDGAIFEMNVSPFFPRHNVIARVDMTGYTGTVLVEGSDTGLWGGEEVTLFTTGAQTTEDRPLQGEIVLKKYMRASTTRSAGTVEPSRDDHDACR